MSDIDELFGVPTPLDRLAEDLVLGDDLLLRELIALRKKRKLSQADVGARLGVSQSAVQQFERPGNDPRLSTIRRYALAVEALIQHQVAPAPQFELNRPTAHDVAIQWRNPSPLFGRVNATHGGDFSTHQRRVKRELDYPLQARK